MVTVPAQFDPLLKEMSTATGIPYSVIAAQANTESGFDVKAVSSAGAEGWLQFLPSTYNSYATQAGVKPGTEFDPVAESKVYDVFMNALLKQEGGSLRDALAAYNAGPGNKAAGYGYADSILGASNTGNITVTGGTGTAAQPASTTGITIPGIGGLSVSAIVTDAFNAFLKMLGLGSMKDLAERFGLIVLGFVMVIVGIHLLASGNGAQAFNIQTSSKQDTAGTTSTRKIKTPVSTHESTKVTNAASSTGATEAAEAAAIA